jgi:hypothetical protein
MCATPSRLSATLRPSHRAPKRWEGSPIQDRFGPLAFGARIQAASYPKCFRPPTHIAKYDGETNPDHWLDDYRLTMRAGGSDDDFAVQYLPLLLSSSVRAWLE